MLNTHSNRQIRLIVATHFIWLAMVCLLGAWWGRLVLKQAQRIADLEAHLGMAVDIAQSHWHRTQRMLLWESATFFALLLACTLLLGWLYLRDVKRARSIHAFFASVTHELRTPLTSIRLQAESIAEGLLMDETRQSKLVSRLLEDTIRLEGQVERTLELARIEGGGPVHLQSVQIKSWLDRFLKSWVSDHKTRVEVVTAIEDLSIDADPVALQIIFKNLLENSLKHSQLDKEIETENGKKKDRVKISISAHPKGQGVAVVLKDNGQGYQGELKNLGRLFQKGASSQGTGVGLYLAKALMRRMNGDIYFDEKPSQGSEVESESAGFRVSLFFPEGRLHD